MGVDYFCLIKEALNDQMDKIIYLDQTFCVLSQLSTRSMLPW